MQNLTVTGIDGDALVAVADTGEEFRIPVDESVQARVRQIAAAADTAPKISPREIQAQIRSGMSAAEVAEATGASLEYVERFEGPVLDERRHIVEQALRVPVKLHTPTDSLGEESQAFGEVIDERLRGLGGTDIRWASWKDESGWLIKVTFTSQGIDHDARWQYEPKRHSLNPVNGDAVTLSQAGEITGGLIPRLRAVGLPAADPDRDDEAEASAATPQPVTELSFPMPQPVPPASPVTLPTPNHPNVALSTEATNQTADLLEVLRRRRGERESVTFLNDEEESSEDDEPIRPVTPFLSVANPPAADDETAILTPRDDIDRVGDTVIERADAHEMPPTLEGIEDALAETGQLPAQPAPPRSSRRSRPTMPSWDEIVFGARERDE